MKKSFLILSLGIACFGFSQPQWTGPLNSTGVITRTGNVGIGTVTVPTAQLHLQTTGAVPFLVERLSSPTTNQDNNLRIAFTSNPAPGIVIGTGSTIIQALNPFGVSDMFFQQSPTATGMIIKAGGNVGIGEVSPATKLSVKGDNIGLVNAAGVFGSTVSSTGAGFSAASKWVSLGSKQPPTANNNLYGFRAQWSNYATDLALIERGAAGTAQDAALIWQDGSIATNLNTGPALTTANSALRFAFRNGTSLSTAGSNVEAARFVIKAPTVALAGFNNSAFLGINNTNPLYEVDVRGKINASSQVLANAIVLTSDRRFKKEIVSINNGLELVRQLNPVNYKFNTEDFKDRYDFDNTLQFGFIAQDLEKVMPSSVVELQDGYKGVNYIMLIPVLTNAIKTMDAELQALKGENASMRKALSNSPNNNGNSIDGKGSIKLLQNVPNPFGNSTLIQYELGNEAKGIRLVVADLTGRTIQVFDNLSNSGKVEVSAESLNNGIYIYSLINASNEVIMSKQMLVQK